MIKFATKLAPTTANVIKASDAGFRCSEVWLNADLLRDWRATARTLRARPLRYVLHFPNKGPLKRGHLKKAVKLHRALDCPAMVIHPGMLNECGATLRERTPHLCLAVENGKLDAAQFWQWAEDHEALTLDVEHFWKYTLEDAPLRNLHRTLRKFLAIHAAKVRHVHLPGYAPGAIEHRPVSENKKMAVAVLDLLETTGFEGMVVSEAREARRTPDELAADVRFFEKWARKRLPKRASSRRFARIPAPAKN